MTSCESKSKQPLIAVSPFFCGRRSTPGPLLAACLQLLRDDQMPQKFESTMCNMHCALGFAISTCLTDKTRTATLGPFSDSMHDIASRVNGAGYHGGESSQESEALLPKDLKKPATQEQPPNTTRLPSLVSIHPPEWEFHFHSCRSASIARPLSHMHGHS